MTERLFSTYQIAKLLGTTLGSVTKWMDDGSLSFCRMQDGTTRVTESALIKFLTEQGIDLGEVLVKAGYAKVAPVDDTSARLPQTVPAETDRTAKATIAVPPDEPIEDEPIDDEPIDDEPIDDEPIDDEPIDDEPDRTDDRPPEQQSDDDEIAPPAESFEETPATQPAEAASSDLRAEQICDAMLVDAAGQGAQTISLTPYRDRLLVQLRTGGVLHDKPNFDGDLPDELRREVIARLLNRADPDIDPEAPAVLQNAEFTRRIDGQDLTLRLSALPTVHGPRLVIHMPGPAADIDSLALEDTARGRLETLLQADGLIVVASKRKTGRDLTLRALLNAADTDGRSVITIERNPAPHLDNAAQLQIDPAAGLTYAVAAGALEHQDADAIILTELRDPATAAKAFDAAHDGALVIAGVNANSASAAIIELLAMGLEPWPLGGTLKAIVEQSSQPDRTVSSSVVFVEGQLAKVIRDRTHEQRDQAIAQARRDT